ncbi:MAG TPA: hypothetical protein VG817_07875 [Gemmatimonadales bacterium]|nr:hypothetical protein [Gemmatimonadales bacterium]
MTDNKMVRIDRAAIERIIQRAAELQTHERDLSEGLAPNEIVALGKEVGIPERFLQQALLEERTRTEPVSASGIMDRTIGIATITASRVVRGDAADIERRLLRWIAEHELLTVQRQTSERITWEPLGGMSAALRRSSAAIGGHKPFMLSRAGMVSAAITSLEPGYVHVALTAELQGARASIAGGMGAMGAIGAASVAVLAVLSPLWWVPLVPIVPFIAAGAAIGKSYKGIADRVKVGLERALDHLERSEPTPADSLPTGGVAGLIGNVIRAFNTDPTRGR